ncbi:MAG: rhodanese-like domain-containing protein [Methyloprofundus sp.]|nr:rhodanese-like domain-containing protein [Methyloprofundus sp.]
MIRKIHQSVFISAFILIITGCKFQQPDYINVINASELNTLMHSQDIFLVDVHTPRQQHIKGTDIFIPYNEIEKFQDKLPEDKNTPIYLYCLGGPMGNAAAKSLHDLGYSQLFNLTGGSNAWRNSGFEFE